MGRLGCFDQTTPFPLLWNLAQSCKFGLKIYQKLPAHIFKWNFLHLLLCTWKRVEKTWRNMKIYTWRNLHLDPDRIQGSLAKSLPWKEICLHTANFHVKSYPANHQTLYFHFYLKRIRLMKKKVLNTWKCKKKVKGWLPKILLFD